MTGHATDKMGLSKVSQGQFCALVASSAGIGQWYALVLHTGELTTFAADVTDEIGGLLEGKPPLHIEVTEGDSDKAAELADRVAASDAPVRILSGLGRLSAKDWAALNFLRSRLLGDHGLVFLLDRPSLLLLQKQAPDLDNLLTASSWQLDRQGHALSEKARQERLEALRTWSGLTDEQVVQKAEQGDLPADPEYAEWLVLMGKGELLVG